MIKVVIIADGVDFVLENYDIHYVSISQLPGLSCFFTAESLDNLWQKKNPEYLAFLDWFFKLYRDFDIVVSHQINPFHPEWLTMYFSQATKLYAMVDDPVCTYHRTLSAIWAFDGVFYVSPGYNEFYTTRELIAAYNNGIESKFSPHALFNIPGVDHEEKINSSFTKRPKGMLYVGAYYESKVDRLIRLKKEFGSDFDVFGYWPYKGYRGFLRALKGKPLFKYRVTSLTEEEKIQKFSEYKICFNMHWNEKRETGNMRMYQAPFHGMMMLCDKAAKDQHEIIYAKDEVVYYDNIDDAIEKVRYYLKNDAERISIAKKGFERAIKNYTRDKIWLDLLDWAASLKLLHSR